MVRPSGSRSHARDSVGVLDTCARSARAHRTVSPYQWSSAARVPFPIDDKNYYQDLLVPKCELLSVAVDAETTASIALDDELANLKKNLETWTKLGQSVVKDKLDAAANVPTPTLGAQSPQQSQQRHVQMAAAR